MSAPTSLTKDQLGFLELLNGNPAPHWFAWLQPGRASDGLISAYGHPEQWTHFRAATMRASATVTKAEARELASLGLTANCRITPAGREALAVTA